jgi:hypothetical protein
MLCGLLERAGGGAVWVGWVCVGSSQLVRIWPFRHKSDRKRVPTMRRACQCVGGIFARSAFDSKVFLNFLILLAVGKARQIQMDDPLDMVLLLNCAGRRKFMDCFGACYSCHSNLNLRILAYRSVCSFCLSLFTQAKTWQKLQPLWRKRWTVPFKRIVELSISRR